MQKRGLKILVTIFLAALCLTGCERHQLCSAPPDADVLSRVQPSSEKLKVSVFLDGTTSMKGFIVPGLASRYQQLLPLLESAVGRGWSEAQITFYRFGTLIQELPERKYLEAQHHRFYQATEISQRTLIQNVIDHSSEENKTPSRSDLTVIVTDLFQTDVDVNLISKKIKDRFIANNLAVGIVGIKSQFSGRVYDVGPNNYSFDYRSDNNNPASFRPFYILVIGSHADISNFFDIIFRDTTTIGPETQGLIFSRYLSETVSTFDGSVITETEKLQEITNLLPTDTPIDALKQFKIPDSAVPLAWFKANLRYKPLRYVMPVASPELESEVSAFTCNGASGQSSGTQSLSETEGIRRAFIVKDAYLSESAIDYTAEIIPAALQGAGTYCFKTTLRPKTYKMPDWVSIWDMDSGLVEAWKASPKDFNGATTFNLKALLTNLWDNTLQTNQPVVAEFYSYVRQD
jgi:hypothetical protein